MDQATSIDGLVTELEKETRDVEVLNRQLTRIDQMLVAGKATSHKIFEKIRKLRLKAYIDELKIKRTSLDKLYTQSSSSGFKDISIQTFEAMMQFWHKEDIKAYADIQKRVKQLAHLSQLLYMRNDRTIRIIACDKSLRYHFTDIRIPDNLSIGANL
jgi:hypothetical protein